jgi:hypothetical protein
MQESDVVLFKKVTALEKTVKRLESMIVRPDNVVQVMINNAVALTTGDDKARIRIPPNLNGMILKSASASRKSGTGVLNIMIRNATDAVDMLSTAITIDSGETDSITAATQPVINTANDDVATADQIAIDVDGAGTSALICIVTMTFGY